ncbi:MAG: hypothetical protein D6741_05220 [Planctomycetota bacterium]|nr:MAG: hypothetical protein D6741_05220 [Planctomycetota bacterium]
MNSGDTPPEVGVDHGEPTRRRSQRGAIEDEIRLTEIRAARLGCRFFDVRYAKISQDVLDLVPARVAHEYGILPIAADGGVLDVAAGDPLTPETLDRLRFIVNHSVRVMLSPRKHLKAAIERYYGPPEGETGEKSTVAEPAEPAEPEFREIPELPMAVDPESPAVAKHIQNVLSRGMALGATHALLLPYKGRVKVAYMVDDLVCTDDDLPADALVPITVRLIAMLDFYGGMKIKVRDQQRRLKVHFHGTRFGPAVLIALGQPDDVIGRLRDKAVQLGTEFTELKSVDFPAELLADVPADVAREYLALPIQRKASSVVVAVADMSRQQMLDELRFRLGRTVEFVLAPEGRLRAMIDRCYGAADAEAAPVVLAEFARSRKLLEKVTQHPGRQLSRPQTTEDHPAQAVWGWLQRFGKDGLFQLFDEIARRPELCRQLPDGSFDVVLPQGEVVSVLPEAARRYLEDRIAALRRTVLAKLENLLLSDRRALGLGVAFALYTAACRLGRGEQVTIDPSGLRHEWLNFLYSFILKTHGDIDTNSGLLALLAERPTAPLEAIGRVLDDPSCMVAPDRAEQWIEQTLALTSLDDLVRSDTPMIAKTLEALIGEAEHYRASHLLLVPNGKRLTVAMRIMRRAYTRPPLSGCITTPLLSHLLERAGKDRRWQPEFLRRNVSVNVQFYASGEGPAAVLTFDRDHTDIDEGRTIAAHAGVPFQRLYDASISPEAASLLPPSVALRMRILPLDVTDAGIRLATCRAVTQRRLREWQGLFGRPVEVVMTTENDIVGAIYSQFPPGALLPADDHAVYYLRRWTGYEPPPEDPPEDADESPLPETGEATDASET